MTRRAAFFAATIAMTIGVILLVLYQERFEREASGGERVAVLVAAQDLPLGTVIEEGMLGQRPVPEAYVETRHVPASQAERIVGLRVSSAVRVGESLLWTDLANAEQRRDLSGLVEDGMRAFTIRADETSSFGGLLRPGDRVDVLLTIEDERHRETAPIAQNVLVLAVGRDTGGRVSTSANDSVSQVTLSATIEQSQTFALAQREGRISLALRNPEDIRTIARLPAKTSQSLIEVVRTGAEPR
jgi:pilus assembly protein CpaB